MQIFHSTSDAQNFLSQNGSVVVIGNFDGVHHGHQQILKKAIATATEKNLKSVLLTFDPHPVKVFAPKVAPRLINTLEQKIEILEKSGIDALVLQPFDEKYGEISAEGFFETQLLKHLAAKIIMVGYDFTFGKNRSGNIETLEKLGRPAGITIEIMPAQMVDKTLARSSLIRKLIHEDRIDEANELLCRNYFVDGTIIHGHNRGTALGIHTANLKTENELIPSDGVYATLFTVKGRDYKSVTNIGYNPTFDNSERSIETHIFDFDQDIYDEKVRLYFIKRLRGEIRFATPAALVKQIQKDIISAKEILASEKIIKEPCFD